MAIDDEISILSVNLIRALEQKYGKPIQLKANTPESEKFLIFGDTSLECFGKFEDRSVVVERVPGLNQEYVDDIALIEGSYASLKELEQKANDYNLLFGSPVELEGKVREAFDLVERESGKELILISLAENFPPEYGIISKDETEQILSQQGYQFFKHDIEVRADGVYAETADAKTGAKNETLVAKINIRLL